MGEAFSKLALMAFHLKEIWKRKVTVYSWDGWSVGL
jgi:hypothetical protein